MKGQQATTNELYNIFIFGMILLKAIEMKQKNLVIIEKKLEQHFKKLIKKFQISQFYMKKISDAVYTGRAFTFSN